MHRILFKLDRRLRLLKEEHDDLSWKTQQSLGSAAHSSPGPAYYALMATAGPATDNPVWAKEWQAPNGHTYMKGEPAPRWTDQEIHLAMHPQINMWARKDTRGAFGGSHGSRQDNNRVEDAAMNMHVELQKILAQERDEGRILHGGGFVSYITRRVREAGSTGVGGTDESRSAVGRMNDLIAAKTPEEAIAVANQVGEQFRTTPSHKHDPGNPFGAFSPTIYKLARTLASTLESGDTAALAAVKQELTQAREKIKDSNVLVQGSGTGRRDISTPHGAKVGSAAGDDLAGFFKTKIASVDTPVGDGTDTLGSTLAGSNGIDTSGADKEDIFNALKMGRSFAKAHNQYYDKSIRELARYKLRPIEDGDFRYLIRILDPLLPGKYPYEGEPGKDPEIDPATGAVSQWIQRNKEPYTTDRAAIINDITKGGPKPSAAGGGPGLSAVIGDVKLTPTEQETLELLLGLSAQSPGKRMSNSQISKLRNVSKVRIGAIVQSIVRKTGKTPDDMAQLLSAGGAAPVSAGEQIQFSPDPMDLYKSWVRYYQQEQEDDLDESTKQLNRAVLAETITALNRFHYYVTIYPMLSGQAPQLHKIILDPHHSSLFG